MRRLALIFLLVLLCSLCVMVQQIGTVKAWSGTVHIMVDGSIYPPDAPIQNAGEVYALTGDIVGATIGISVERDNVVIDGSGFVVEAPDPWSGIYLYGRNNVTIRDINVRNCKIGVTIGEFSNNSGLIRSNITACSAYGVYILSSFNNSVYENNVTGNAIGLLLKDSSNNIVFHNNFNNARNVYDMTTSYPNSWDSGGEGNYWSDYTGIDVDQDGIGDTSYIVGGDNADNYPLMAPYIIPEFTSLLVPVLFMASAMLGVIISKRIGMKRARKSLQERKE